MDWFFDEWLYKMGHPVFEVTQSYDDAAKKLTLNVKQTQKLDINNQFPQTEYFQSYVDVAVDNKVSRVWLDPKAENVFTFDSATKPKLVNFDYEGTLLKEMKFEKSTDELLYQMANDKDVIGRRWAMGELEKKAANAGEKARIVEALITSAEKDPFWRVRRAALSVIASIYSPDPAPGQERPAAKLDSNVEAATLKLTKDKESLIRADAVELLGETKDAKHAGVYLTALNDRSYSVIDQAATALGDTKDAKAYDALVKLTTTPSWKGRIQTAGFEGLARLGDKRSFEIGYKAATDKTLAPQVRANALAIVAATGKGDPRAFDLIFASFKTAFAGENTQQMIGSMQALVNLGDPRAQQAIDMLKTKFKDNPGAMQAISAFESALKAAAKP
jgi:aminopeptidase N